MTARFIVLVASLALLAGCASGGKPADEKPGGREQTLVEMRAVVVGVDQKHRLLALEGDDGGRMVLPVAEEFRDFERALTITATISAFDPARGTVTLTGPQGRSQTFKVHRPAELEKLRVGDLVDITYSEALAVGVRPEVRQ